MNTIYRIFIFLLVVGGAACASSETHRVGSGGEDEDIGLGGTGLLVSEGNGLGGTGIVGRITGFGSIFVNGIEVEYDNNTVMTIDGESSASHQLEIGDFVEILTADGNKHTRALAINVRHEIIGEVDTVNVDDYSFNIHGQTIIHAINTGEMPDPGETVAVAGFRVDEKTILSTRITPVENGGKLLRDHNELPFRNRVTRWLVQAYIQKGKVSFKINGTVHSLAVDGELAKTIKNGSGVGILQIQKTSTGELKIDKLTDTVDMPQGKSKPEPGQHNGNNMGYKSMPGKKASTSPGSMPSNINQSTPSGVKRRNR